MVGHTHARAPVKAGARRVVGALVASAPLLGGLCAPGTGQASPPPRLEASPRQLLAGRDGRATLTLTGLPDDTRLACSAGQVHAPTRVSPDTLQAPYVAPPADTLAPILCAAVSPSTGAHATVVLETRRQQVLPLSGLPPLSRVEVRIGERLHGPVRADTTGQAEVPVLLVPGHTHATLLSTVPGEPTQERPWPLPVASRAALVLLPEADGVEASGQRGVRVWAFGVEAQGAPARTPPVFTRSGGTWEPQAVAPGVQVGPYVPFPRATPGEAVLTASGDGVSATARLELRPGVRPVLRLEASAHEVLADGDSGTDLTVHVRDERGRALPGQAVRLQASRGQVSPPQDRGDGTYLARYRAPHGGGGVQLTALLEGTPSATLGLTLRVPPRLQFEASAHTLPADGHTRLMLQVTARDAEGQLAPDGTELALSTPLGAVPATVRTQGGRARVEYVADTRAGEALVQARWDAASTSTPVRLVPGPPARLRVGAEARPVRCDGEDSARVHLLVQDAQGNPLDGVPIDLRAVGTQAEHGGFEPVAALGPGEFVTRYHAPTRCEGGTATLLARVGEARADTRLQLEPRTPWGLSVRLGAQGTLGARVQPALEVEADVSPYVLGERLAATAALQVAYGGLSLHGESAAHAPFALTARALTSTLSLGGRWRLPLTRALSAYVGAGLDAHLVHLDWHLSLESSRQQQLTPVLGGHARVGLAWSLGSSGALLVQARHGLARLPAASAFQGPVGGPSVSLGYRFER